MSITATERSPATTPGIDAGVNRGGIEASLDAEWANATSPSANLIFMSCDTDPDGGTISSMTALIDNNLSDVMSMSYSATELTFTSGEYSLFDSLDEQAATQGQSIFVSTGDAGSDMADQDTETTATSGINVNAFASPLVTLQGARTSRIIMMRTRAGSRSPPIGARRTSNILGVRLATSRRRRGIRGCASSILTHAEGDTGAGLCGAVSVTTIDGTVIGGSGGISTHYDVPSWQTGISGYSNSMHSIPDIAGFASNGFWGHALIFCDSNPTYTGDYAVAHPPVSAGGGTSFVAPYLAGAVGLLRTATGSRQGVLNPGLYALGKAQYTASATKTACYANGQTSNTGVTTGLPAAACIFNDVTTSNNDVPCKAGSTDCYVNTGDSYGMFRQRVPVRSTVAYPSTIGFDQATGLGTVNVNNLITMWNTAFTSSTSLVGQSNFHQLQRVHGFESDCDRWIPDRVRRHASGGYRYRHLQSGFDGRGHLYSERRNLLNLGAGIIASIGRQLRHGNLFGKRDLSVVCFQHRDGDGDWYYADHADGHGDAGRIEHYHGAVGLGNRDRKRRVRTSDTDRFGDPEQRQL